MGARQFELPELKLLVDAVQASRFIPPVRAKALIAKLSTLASAGQAGQLQRSLHTDKTGYAYNSKAYIAVDMLHAAINAGKKVTFKYFDWDNNKKKEYKHGRRDYLFSPYGLVWNNDRYYAIGWCDSHNHVTTFRVDRIAAPKLTDEPAVPAPTDFDMAYYAETVFQMYDGPTRRVTLVCEGDMMKHIIDRFGEGVETVAIADGRFEAYVDVPTSPTFFAWVFTFCGKMHVTAPEEAVRAFEDMARKSFGSDTDMTTDNGKILQ